MTTADWVAALQQSPGIQALAARWARCQTVEGRLALICDVFGWPRPLTLEQEVARAACDPRWRKQVRNWYRREKHRRGKATEGGAVSAVAAAGAAVSVWPA